MSITVHVITQLQLMLINHTATRYISNLRTSCPLHAIHYTYRIFFLI